MSKLKETQLSTEQIYKGTLLDVRRDEITLPNGKTSAREYIKHPGAACISQYYPMEILP
jgi:ADP-ribose pyrophosphatase